MKFAIAPLPHTFPLRPDPAAVDAAMHWASEEAQCELLARLDTEFDGFAVAMRPGTDGPEHRFWLEVPDIRFLTWSHMVMAKGGRQKRNREVIAVRSPRTPLYDPAADWATNAFIRPGTTSKSSTWLQWVLAHLGALPGVDDVHHLFADAPASTFEDMLPLEASHA